MKVRDRLKQQIYKDFLLSLLFIFGAVISLAGFNTMPKLFVFLCGGAVFVLGEAVLLWMKYLKTDPFMDEIAAHLVTVSTVNENSIVLEGRNPVLWSEVDEIRKVYRAVGSFAVIALPRMSPAATRRFFYVIHLHSGEWLELANVNLMAFKGSFRTALTKSPDVADLLKRFLTEAGKQPPIRLVCHNEAMGRFEALDLRREMEDLLKWEKK